MVRVIFPLASTVCPSLTGPSGVRPQVPWVVVVVVDPLPPVDDPFPAPGRELLVGTNSALLAGTVVAGATVLGGAVPPPGTVVGGTVVGGTVVVPPAVDAVPFLAWRLEAGAVVVVVGAVVVVVGSVVVVVGAVVVVGGFDVGLVAGLDAVVVVGGLDAGLDAGLVVGVVSGTVVVVGRAEVGGAEVVVAVEPALGSLVDAAAAVPRRTATPAATNQTKRATRRPGPPLGHEITRTVEIPSTLCVAG
ncbi:MAG TPA: hypothetical protein VMF60_01540 [Acidimicrobiales bacterium]|nr:hypothetical protein [Acidimicrobiales bacterium]